MISCRFYIDLPQAGLVTPAVMSMMSALSTVGYLIQTRAVAIAAAMSISAILNAVMVMSACLVALFQRADCWTGNRLTMPTAAMMRINRQSKSRYGNPANQTCRD